MHIVSTHKILATIGAALLLTLPVVRAQSQTQEQTAVQIETLLQSDSSWDGTPYTDYPQGAPQLTVLKMTIPPHSSLPWHTHPMPNAAYVVSGELTVEKKENGQKKILTPGQVLPEMVDALHRGTTGDQPVVLIVFYAGTKDMPLSKH